MQSVEVEFELGVSLEVYLSIASCFICQYTIQYPLYHQFHDAVVGRRQSVNPSLVQFQLL